MEWLAVAGIVLVVVVAVLGATAAAPPPAAEDEDDEYRWGDELQEYSYRHPWDDE